MSTVLDRLEGDPARLWAGTVLGLLVALVGGTLAFPRVVYDGFVWRYFWGPVQADANSAVCAVRDGGTTGYLGSSSACSTAQGFVAYPGYTLVSEVGYVVVLLLALIGVVFLLRRLRIGEDRRFYFALVPFMFFGGALRVVEDANDMGDPSLISYPWNTLIISPIIYFTVFFVTLAALLAAVWVARRGLTENYERPLFGVGLVALLASLGYLVALAATPDNSVVFYPQVITVILVGTTVATAVVWWLVGRYAPEINRGTGLMGVVVIWGHAVDGVANVVGLDWMSALNAGANLVPKHPVNRAIVDVTGAILPASVLAVTGDAWPFLVVKLAAAVAVVWIFDAEIFEESPRYAILMLVAITAVGLGPGTRDMLRATFGV
ncbi:MAG: DUF63 family protein [Haloferacaceae archaeon]